ncbi:Anaerobic respiratory complex protein QmoB [hydrothermal vent metagenome]|uniref:Anaerobic respiratory complex protein QmoB n=1 Tax=hydrothermal vent metagenome TaxID=652676 RepID=A0A3B1BRK9_9ZZZZ
MTQEQAPKKTGAYICSGCSIGECMNVDELFKVASSELKTPVVKTHPFLCGSEGVELIKSDIANDGVNAVSVAACSVRVNYDIFDFGPDIILDRIDIRERVAWCHEPNDEETQALAEDYIRMGLAKIKEMNLTSPYKIESTSQTIMVVGGGIAGLTAAINAAMAGHKVELVEKADRLGGFMNNLKRIFPQTAPYETASENNIADHIKAVEDDPDVTIHLNTTIESISGGPGMFDVSLKNGSVSKINIGAIVLATGFRPYDMSKLTHLGAGLPNVISGVDLEKMALDDDIKRPSDGKPARRIVFALCAGSRCNEHLQYCSSVCCSASLKQADYIRKSNPDASVTIVYRDIRTTGATEHFYKSVQQDPGIFLTKGDVDDVKHEGDELYVTIKNTLLGEPVTLKADMLILATGMVPSAFDEKVVATIPADQMQDFDREQVSKASILNLEYRQGPELPDLAYGFADSHFICFPYETRRTGIYSAGAVRHPQDIATARNDAVGAALKAIQCVKMVGQGRAVHPRAGDDSYPEFAMERCTQCKRCTVECPFGAINEDEKANPIPFPTRCRRCATCLGACPVQIISFKNYSIQMIGAMIKSIDMPDEFDEKPRVLAFICENDAMPALDMAGINRLKYSPIVRFIQLRCLGSINLQWVADALSSGWDGIMMIGCKHGDDYQCHNIKGSAIAEERTGKVQETLDRLMLESDRIRVESLAINDYHKIPELIDGFVEEIGNMEPNPYKGF